MSHSTAGDVEPSVEESALLLDTGAPAGPQHGRLVRAAAAVIAVLAMVVVLCAGSANTGPAGGGVVLVPGPAADPVLQRLGGRARSQQLLRQRSSSFAADGWSGIVGLEEVGASAATEGPDGAVSVCIEDTRKSGRFATSLDSALRRKRKACSVKTEEVLAVQKAWGEALVSISTAYDERGFQAAKARAEQVLDDLYGYSKGLVLFKPTLTFGNQTFRITRASALAYFVGGDPAFPNDSGFALKHWRKVEIQNAAIIRRRDTASTMGNVKLTNWDGTSVVVDKTWSFVKGTNGKLYIVLHHSSLPFAPSKKIPQEDVLAAQRAWGDALVNISTTFDEQGFEAAKARAEEVVDQLYGYQYGPVLFKPTLAYGNQTFRLTRAAALAYFVGGDPDFPNDNGFALKHWRKVDINNSAVFLDTNIANTIGNVKLTDWNGTSVVVDKSWSFVKGTNGKLYIVLHHSSLPFAPSKKIPEEDVLAAQKAWGDALVSISTTFDEKGFEAAKARAEEVVDQLYGYQYGAVLFKPTLAYGSQTFRNTRAAALAYFVGGDPDFPNDKGFALKSWRSVEITNSAIFLDINIANTQGKVKLTDKDGNSVSVDKSWSFLRGSDGKLYIMLHHSSLPYVP